MHGKLLWVQHQVKNGVLKLKQIPTLWNPADLGTKGLSRRRHNMLLYLFGFVDEKGGELEKPSARRSSCRRRRKVPSKG